MCRTGVLSPARIGCAALAGVLLMHGPVSAQDVTEPALKAAFIYNFAKFTEWPAAAAPAQEPYVLCVIGDDAVADQLQRAVKAREISGHTIRVSSGPDGAQQKCHVLYVSGMTAGQAAQVVAGLRDMPVLTISDVEGFTGIARFFFEQGRLRFSVQVESAERAHLQISSRLLGLGIRK
jgi:YfiR/HmsC-like